MMILKYYRKYYKLPNKASNLRCHVGVGYCCRGLLLTSIDMLLLMLGIVAVLVVVADAGGYF